MTVDKNDLKNLERDLKAQGVDPNGVKKIVEIAEQEPEVKLTFCEECRKVDDEMRALGIMPLVGGRCEAHLYNSFILVVEKLELTPEELEKEAAKAAFRAKEAEEIEKIRLQKREGMFVKFGELTPVSPVAKVEGLVEDLSEVPSPEELEWKVPEGYKVNEVTKHYFKNLKKNNERVAKALGKGESLVRELDTFGAGVAYKGVRRAMRSLTNEEIKEIEDLRSNPLSKWGEELKKDDDGFKTKVFGSNEFKGFARALGITDEEIAEQKTFADGRAERRLSLIKSAEVDFNTPSLEKITEAANQGRQAMLDKAMALGLLREKEAKKISKFDFGTTFDNNQIKDGLNELPQGKFWYQGNKQHRLDGPAVKLANGNEIWCQDGNKHRLDGPAETTDKFQAWYINGKCHRVDEPAVIWNSGEKEWYTEGIRTKLETEGYVYHFATEQVEVSTGLGKITLPQEKIVQIDHPNGTVVRYQNGKKSATDAPAIEFKSKKKIFMTNGKVSRLEGPAVEQADGAGQYWINSKLYTVEGLLKRVDQLQNPPSPEPLDPKLTKEEFDAWLDYPIYKGKAPGVLTHSFDGLAKKASIIALSKRAGEKLLLNPKGLLEYAEANQIEGETLELVKIRDTYTLNPPPPAKEEDMRQELEQAEEKFNEEFTAIFPELV